MLIALFFNIFLSIDISVRDINYYHVFHEFDRSYFNYIFAIVSFIRKITKIFLQKYFYAEFVALFA